MAKQLRKWIGNNQVAGEQIRLDNDQYLRGRNAANTADVSLLKINANDRAEFGAEPVYNGTPSTANSLTTRQYVQDVLAGVRDPKDAVDLATTAALPANTAAGAGVGKTLTADANGALTVDGVAVTVGMRILVKDEATAADNGVYIVTQVGDGANPFILTRATDFDEDAEVTKGASMDVVEGTANGKTRWVLSTNDPITVDTSSLTFVQVAAAPNTAQFNDEQFTLDSTDIANGYVDLAQQAENGSVIVWPDGAVPQRQGTDYTLSVEGGVTRVTFAGDLASTLADGDVLIVKYAYFA